MKDDLKRLVIECEVALGQKDAANLKLQDAETASRVRRQELLDAMDAANKSHIVAGDVMYSRVWTPGDDKPHLERQGSITTL